MTYQTLLRKLAPSLNPAGVEASMRLHYGTLNHLPRETFAAEAKIAERMGIAGDFAKWEGDHVA